MNLPLILPDIILFVNFNVFIMLFLTKLNINSIIYLVKYGDIMEPQAISSDLIRGHIDTIILHTLLDGDKFPQQISDSIEQKSDGVYKINQATLYSSLKRLVNLKFITAYWQDSDNGGRRKFFKLTDAGKTSIDENMSNWSFSRTIIDKLIDCTPTAIQINQVDETEVNNVELSSIEPNFEPILDNNLDNQQDLVQSNNDEQILQQNINSEYVAILDQASQLSDNDLEDNINQDEQVESETLETEMDPALRQETVQEIHFRHILNDIKPHSQLSEESALEQENQPKNIEEVVVNDENDYEQELLTKQETTQEIQFRNILNDIKPHNVNPIIPDNAEQENLLENVEKTVSAESEDDLIKQESTQEINFRNILQDLVQTNEPRKLDKELTELRPLENIEDLPIEIDENQLIDLEELQSFSQTINEKNHHIVKTAGPIDYSDLFLMAAKDGLKLKISSKTSSQRTGSLLINKLRLYTSLAMFLVCLVELLIVTSIYKTALNLNTGIVFLLIALLAVVPVITIINNKNNPMLLSAKTVSKDTILTTGIIVFNLILINFACIMLVNVDFAIAKDVAIFAVIPALVYIDVLIYSVLVYYFANSKICEYQKPKKAAI